MRFQAAEAPAIVGFQFSIFVMQCIRARTLWAGKAQVNGKTAARADGRISVFGGVGKSDMRKKHIPSIIAPEHFQTEQCFVSLESPILAGSLEAALRLPASRFHRTAADGLASQSRPSVIHPILMFSEIVQFGFDGLG